VCIEALFMDEPTCLLADRECFDTIQFLVPHKGFHPGRRPFVLVYSVAQDLVSCQHLMLPTQQKTLGFLVLGFLLV
jgi:hypothetical protein